MTITTIGWSRKSLWRVARDIYIAESAEEARKDVMGGTLARDFTEYFFKMVPKIRGNLDIFKTEKSMSDSEVTIEYMMDNLWIVGSPDDAVEKIRELYDHVGGFGVLLVMGHEWKPEDKWKRSMRLLAEDVMPRLRDLK